MSDPIQNCTWKFTIQCPREWSKLQSTPDAAVRFCETCLRQVYRCDTDAQVRAHVKAGHCVAIHRMWEQDASEQPDDESMYLGMIEGE